MRSSLLRAAALVLAAAGCSSSRQGPELAATTKERDALRAEKAELERRVGELRAALAKSASAAAPKAAAAPAEPSAAAGASSSGAAKAWTADATQLRDAGRREAALAAVRDALAGDDAVGVAAALAVLPQIARVRYDKGALHGLVLRHARSPDAAVRAGVPFALLNTDGPRPGDLEIVLALCADAAAEVRASAGRSLVFFAKNDLTGPAGERALALLDDPDRQVRRDVLASIWGARISPQIEKALLARFHGDDPELRHDAFHFGISPQKEKSPAVVDACIEAMESADPELQWRGRWGVGQGVAEADRGRVGDAYVRLLAARSDTQLEADAFQWLRRHGTASHASEIEKLATNPLVADATKAAALETAEAIRKRGLR